MRHILLYESFEDHLDPLTRELFGLTSEIQLGHGFSISGPLEHAEAANSIADDLRKYIDTEVQSYSNLARSGMVRGKRHDFIEYSLSVDKPKELEDLARMGYTFSIQPRLY